MPSISLKEYNRIHKWTERNLIKLGKCFYCNKKCRTQWSNIDHAYRQIESEWQETCTKCHHKFDQLMNGKKKAQPKLKQERRRRIGVLKRKALGNITITHAVLSHMRQRATIQSNE